MSVYTFNHSFFNYINRYVTNKGCQGTNSLSEYGQVNTSQTHVENTNFVPTIVHYEYTYTHSRYPRTRINNRVLNTREESMERNESSL